MAVTSDQQLAAVYAETVRIDVRWTLRMLREAAQRGAPADPDADHREPFPAD